MIPTLLTAADLALGLYDRAYRIDDESPGEAIDLYRRVLHYDPAHASAMINLGRLYYLQGAGGTAELWWRKALLQPAPGHLRASAHFNLGHLRLLRDRFEEAIECFEAALAWDPTYADAHFMLAEALTAEERTADARRHYRWHLRLKGEFREATLERLGLRVVSGGR